MMKDASETSMEELCTAEVTAAKYVEDGMVAGLGTGQ